VVELSDYCILLCQVVAYVHFMVRVKLLGFAVLIVIEGTHVHPAWWQVSALHLGFNGVYLFLLQVFGCHELSVASDLSSAEFNELSHDSFVVFFKGSSTVSHESELVRR